MAVMCITQGSQIGYDILAYLCDHPEAQDTLEGIVEWWLLEQKIKRRTAEVRAVLAELVARGLVLERCGGDSRIQYRINPDKYEEIRALLEERSGSHDPSGR